MELAISEKVGKQKEIKRFWSISAEVRPQDGRSAFQRRPIRHAERLSNRKIKSVRTISFGCIPNRDRQDGRVLWYPALYGFHSNVVRACQNPLTAIPKAVKKSESSKIVKLLVKKKLLPDMLYMHTDMLYYLISLSWLRG